MNKALYHFLLANSDFDFDKAIKLAIELGLSIKLSKKNSDDNHIIQTTKQQTPQIIADLNGEDKEVAFEKAINFLITSIQ